MNESGRFYNMPDMHAGIRYGRLVDTFSKNILGPMPVQHFLDEFLPQGPANKPLSAEAFSSLDMKFTNEAQIYAPLVSGFESC